MADRTERQQLVDAIVAELQPGGRIEAAAGMRILSGVDPTPSAEAIVDVAAEWFTRHPNIITGGPKPGSLAAMKPAQRAAAVVGVVILVLALLLVAAIVLGGLAWAAHAVWAGATA